jgi:hypothetical protein
MVAATVAAVVALVQAKEHVTLVILFVAHDGASV